MVVGGRELIDTLWNVNLTGQLTRGKNQFFELIDTLWNVNETSASPETSALPEN